MSQIEEFAGQCLEQSPCGILALDHEGRISWINTALEEMLGLPGDALIGQTEGTLATSHSGLFKGTGLMHLISVNLDQERWFQCTVLEPMQNLPGVTLKVFQDVSELMQLRQENSRLRQQVEELTITDDLTGLANRRALTHALNAQVTRSRRYQNPLCLVALELSEEGLQGHEIEADTILSTSRHLRDRLRWVDVIGRWDHNQFFIILPETSRADGIELLSKIIDEFSSNRMGEHGLLTLSYGLAEWEKGCDSRKLMQMAVDALQNPAGD